MNEQPKEVKPVQQDYFKNQVFKDLDWDNNFQQDTPLPF
jgi:hypothetical protein